MNLIGGLILLAMAVGLMLIARPKGDEPVPFLRDRPWVIGQAYVMFVLVLFVLGAAIVIINRPFP